jgi:hypothetical protein
MSWLPSFERRGFVYSVASAVSACSYPFDDAALTMLYGADVYGGPGNFHIIRDNQILNAVVVSVGRFGVIYSSVLRAVPQYSLWERRGTPPNRSIPNIIWRT